MLVLDLFEPILEVSHFIDRSIVDLLVFLVLFLKSFHLLLWPVVVIANQFLFQQRTLLVLCLIDGYL